MNKIIFDVIHGFIEVDEISLKIIDTPEFQRLRNIKQLGVVNLVFPSANHSRFEHSIGVYHLAGELINNLMNNQPELKITPRECQLIKIAGLCHDLGHGPFSHLLDNIILKNESSIYREHENRSCLILNYIIKKYQIEISNKELDFIFSIINPSNYKNTTEKLFFYEIVCNTRNGIDVDKFDYLKRDTFYLGLSYSMDCSRIIKHVRVIDNKICYLDKTYNHILEMYEVRTKLHSQIYKHHAVIGFELMIADIIQNVEDIINIKDSINIPFNFCSLDDYILNMIDYLTIKIDSNEKNEKNAKLIKSKNLIHRLKSRKQYKLIKEANIKNQDKSDSKESLIEYEYNLGYHKNPFDNIYFYTKKNNNNYFLLNKDFNNIFIKKVSFYIKDF